VTYTFFQTINPPPYHLQPPRTHVSTCYTNALSLLDLYPYGTQNGGTMRTGSSLPEVLSQPPINNLHRFGQAGLLEQDIQYKRKSEL
uniref:Uncharacterized protein n=1 Tax=Amphimedon queenslandica TaxID=400682 RepID=A0A1X7U0I9_AMPQE